LGKLHEQTIPTLFNGISRQPQSVRFTGQVEAAENVDFSVESGGFSKRLGLRIKKKLLGLTTGSPYTLHTINRDINEKYHVIIGGGDIRVFDHEGNQRTVNKAAGANSFLSNDPSEYAILTLLDYTFVVNKTKVVRMDPTKLAPVPPKTAVLYFQMGHQGASGNNFRVTINGTQVEYTAQTADDASQVAGQIHSLLEAEFGPTFEFRRDGSYLTVRRADGGDFTISQTSPAGDTGIILRKDIVSRVEDLPAKTRHGTVFKVSGVTGEGYYVRFIADDGNRGDGRWRETVEPGTEIQFDPDTMPWGLIRQANGEFSFGPLEWNEKLIGGGLEVPNPDFVGEKIYDLVSTRNRLGIVAGETVYFSQAGDVFNFWPETSTEIIPSDPFGVTNTTDSVSRFYFAVPFRRSVFVMGDNAQFEISGDVFSMEQASIDLATSYSASPICRPVAVGDELYFPAETGDTATILSYFYDQNTVSETAFDVTKHVAGLIPAPIVDIAGDPISGQVWVLSDAARDKLFVHRFYYQGEERVQSAWSVYRFDGVKILAIDVLDGVVTVLYEWRGAIWLGHLPTNPDVYSDFDWVPRLDHHQMLQGVYDAETNRTSWTLEYVPNDPVLVTSSVFPENLRQLSYHLDVDGTTVSTEGDLSAHPVMIGENFESFVEFSKQFVRDENGTAIVNGRLQLKRMTLRYVASGYFEVEVIPFGRPVKRYIHTGRILGSSENRIQRYRVGDGKFSFGINSDGETATIRVKSNNFMPLTITSAAWIGFFNEISRQG